MKLTHKEQNGLEHAPIYTETNPYLDVIMNIKKFGFVNEVEISIGDEFITSRIRVFAKVDGKTYLCKHVMERSGFEVDDGKVDEVIIGSHRFFATSFTPRVLNQLQREKTKKVKIKTGVIFNTFSLPDINDVLQKADLVVFNFQNASTTHTPFVEKTFSSYFGILQRNKCKLMIVNGMEKKSKVSEPQQPHELFDDHIVITFERSIETILKTLGSVTVGTQKLSAKMFNHIPSPPKIMGSSLDRRDMGPTQSDPVDARQMTFGDFFESYSVFNCIWPHDFGHFVLLDQTDKGVRFVYGIMQRERIDDLSGEMFCPLQMTCEIPNTTLRTVWESKDAICDHIVLCDHTSYSKYSSMIHYSIDDDFLVIMNKVCKKATCIIVDLSKVVSVDVEDIKSIILKWIEDCTPYYVRVDPQIFDPVIPTEPRETHIAYIQGGFLTNARHVMFLN